MIGTRPVFFFDLQWDFLNCPCKPQVCLAIATAKMVIMPLLMTGVIYCLIHFVDAKDASVDCRAVWQDVGIGRSRTWS